MTRVVGAFSGGGAKTAAHLGAWKALDEHGLRPAHYVGTSMGAVIAACLAAGRTYEDLVRRFVELRRRDVAALAPTALLGYFSEALLVDGPLRETIGRLVSVDTFDALETPLTVTAVDRANGQLVLFGEGGRPHVSLVDALYASCALPFYYPPAVIGGREYVDGGLRAVLPIDVAATFEPELIVAVAVGPSFYEEPAVAPVRLPPLVRMAGDVLRVTMADQAERTIARWRDSADPEVIVVRPPTIADTTFALDLAIPYVEEGYRATVRALAGRTTA